VASENTVQGARQSRRITSENTTAALDASYRAVLARAPLSAETARTYLSKVRGYLAGVEQPSGCHDPHRQHGLPTLAVASRQRRW